jgi:hypothetical protein
VSEKPVQIVFHPNPVQKSFIESRATADLFSSRMGEGKSAAICWGALWHTRRNHGANWAILRDTWENLQATTMKEFFKWFPPGIAGEFHHTKREWTWASGLAEGTVVFLGADDPQDASKLMSRELAGFGMDEPAPAVGSAGIDELVFDIAMSRLRQPGMEWYAAKLAENNPDEAHWTYRRFAHPGTDGFAIHQPPAPENTQNLPHEYYAGLRKMWQHRPDLIRRFVDGEFGFQQIGKSVTPQWADRFHLAHGLVPVRSSGLHLLWDFGHNPTCVITQKTPLGQWLILEAHVGEDMGVEELIVDAIKPILLDRYRGMGLSHIGDPAGQQREQTSIHRSAVKLLRQQLGGTWRAGPVRLHERLEPLRSALTRQIGGRGLVQVDRDKAAAVWHALRGGWHYHVARSGLVSGLPQKNVHSHPGDAMSYGAAILFPIGKVFTRVDTMAEPEAAHGWGKAQVGAGVPGQGLPAHGSGVILPGGLGGIPRR